MIGCRLLGTSRTISDVRLESAKRPEADMDNVAAAALPPRTKRSQASRPWGDGKTPSVARRDGLGASRGWPHAPRKWVLPRARNEGQGPPPDDMLPSAQGYRATVLVRPRVLRLDEPMIPMHRQGG
jgi:hypothetical protein